MQLSRASAYGFLFVGMAITGSYVALSKPLAEAIPVFLLAMLRFGIAAVAMVPWTRDRQGDMRPSSRDWRFALPAIVLRPVPVLDLHAVRRRADVGQRGRDHSFDDAGRGRRAVGSLSRRAADVPRDRRGGAGRCRDSSAPGHASRCVIATGDDHVILGNLLVFASVCCEAAYVIIGKRLTATLSAMRISALINLIGLALIVPFGLWQARTFDFGALARTCGCCCCTTRSRPAC
jgi:drug/metabolite transporter (DMT)-like permease